MLGNEEFLLCLDEHYVMNVAFNHNTDPYYGFVFQNGIYFVANKKQYKELEAYITEISNSNNCPVTIYPSEKIFKDYINTYNEYYYVTTFQTVLKLILSFLGLFIASVVSLLKQRDTLMIMYRYGVSRKEHVIIHAVSNVIKCVIAMSASYSLMFIRCFNMAYNKLVYFKEMVVVSVLTVIAAVIFVEIVTDILLLKYLNEVNKSE